jgi:hypothetical protein
LAIFVENLSCSHNISPKATKLLRNINQGRLQQAKERCLQFKMAVGMQ